MVKKRTMITRRGCVIALATTPSDTPGISLTRMTFPLGPAGSIALTTEEVLRLARALEREAS